MLHTSRFRSTAGPGGAARVPSLRHVHWFRRLGDDPYSGTSLYACRCGVVRPGF